MGRCWWNTAFRKTHIINNQNLIHDRIVFALKLCTIQVKVRFSLKTLIFWHKSVSNLDGNTSFRHMPFCHMPIRHMSRSRTTSVRRAVLAHMSNPHMANRLTWRIDYGKTAYGEKAYGETT